MLPDSGACAHSPAPGCSHAPAERRPAARNGHWGSWQGYGRRARQGGMGCTKCSRPMEKKARCTFYFNDDNRRNANSWQFGAEH